jgi:Putative zinc-finger
MTHPEELLAPYVDGTASPQERAAVDAHASSCAHCRGEIAAATAARAALRRLPVVNAPAGLAPDTHVVTPAGRPGDGVPGWYRWAGAAAVAAVIVLLVALVLPNIGRHPSTSEGAFSGNDGKTTASGPVQIEIQAQDYQGTTLSDLLKAQVGATTPNANVAATPASAETSPQTGTAKQATDARACIKAAFRKVPGHLIRLISARFAGAPAYIGIYEQGPRGQPFDTIVGRVASADTCTLLTIATARLGP